MVVGLIIGFVIGALVGILMMALVSINRNKSYYCRHREDSDLNWKILSLQEKKDLVATLSKDIQKKEPDKVMTLQEFTRLVSDEDERCTLEIDNGDDSDYTYLSFWLSDFRSNMARANKCKNYIVTGFSIGYKSELVIEVKKV